MPLDLRELSGAVLFFTPLPHKIHVSRKIPSLVLRLKETTLKAVEPLKNKWKKRTGGSVRPGNKTARLDGHCNECESITSELKHVSVVQKIKAMILQKNYEYLAAKSTETHGKG